MEFSNMQQKNKKSLLRFTDDGIQESKENRSNRLKLWMVCQKLIKETVFFLEKKPDAQGLVVFGELVKALREKAIPQHKAREIFGNLNYELKNRYGYINQFQFGLNHTAIEYFKSVFLSDFQIPDFEQIENDKLLEIRRKVRDKKKTYNFHEIKEFDVDDDRFEYLALREIYIGLTKEFRKRQIVSRQKKQLENLDTKEKETSTSRNQRQVFLALEMILQLLKSGGNKTENKEMMSFLSGYSAESLRKCYSQSDNWEDKKSALEYVKELSIKCKLLALSKRADEQIKQLGNS